MLNMLKTVTTYIWHYVSLYWQYSLSSLIVILAVVYGFFFGVPLVESFQEPASISMYGIIRFHDELMTILCYILGLVLYMLYAALLRIKNKSSEEVYYSTRLVHATTLEFVWTIIPAVILMFIAVPSFALLYSMEELVDPSMIVKVVGHQWYWTYEFPEFYENETLTSYSFDSYLFSDETDSMLGDWVKLYVDSPSETSSVPSDYFLSLYKQRLLSVDHILRLPVNTRVAAIVTSTDVLHSWAIPALGIKIDACPGRLNEVSLVLSHSGLFVGQCSEICGQNHGFMPIAIGAVDFALATFSADYDCQWLFLLLSAK